MNSPNGHFLSLWMRNWNGHSWSLAELHVLFGVWVSGAITTINREVPAEVQAGSLCNWLYLPVENTKWKRYCILGRIVDISATHKDLKYLGSSGSNHSPHLTRQSGPYENPTVSGGCQLPWTPPGNSINSSSHSRFVVVVVAIRAEKHKGTQYVWSHLGSFPFLSGESSRSSYIHMEWTTVYTYSLALDLLTLKFSAII